MSKVKFATKIESEVLTELRTYSEESKVPISDIVSDAVAIHLRSVRIRPIFKEAAEKVLRDNEELLRGLANK